MDKVHKRVLEGMGLIVLHSGHYSKIFKKLMGTGCGLKWREAAELERIWCVNPGHAIADGLGEYFELQHTEMYGELFDIPTPDELVFISWFEGGDIFRSGCCWTRGKGHVFYFRPGHETFPIYHDANVQRVIANGVRWASPRIGSPYDLRVPQIKKKVGGRRAFAQIAVAQCFVWVWGDLIPRVESTQPDRGGSRNQGKIQPCRFDND